MPKGAERKLPDDAVLTKQIGSFDFFFSRQHHSFFITVEEYHAGPVKFSKPDILELLRIYDTHTEEKEKELLTELQQVDDDDDF